MKSRTLELALVLLAMVTQFTTAAFAADMFSGTWALNTAKTTASHVMIPVIEKIEADDKGIKVVAVNSVGWEHDEYAVKFDGSDYPYTGMDRKPNLDAPSITYSAKKIDDYTIEFTIRIRDLALTRILGREIMSISKDGKTRTVTQSGTNAQGKAFNDTVVYEKQ